jgi:hypothetical protein
VMVVAGESIALSRITDATQAQKIKKRLVTVFMYFLLIVLLRNFGGEVPKILSGTEDFLKQLDSWGLLSYEISKKTPLPPGFAYFAKTCAFLAHLRSYPRACRLKLEKSFSEAGKKQKRSSPRQIRGVKRSLSGSRKFKLLGRMQLTVLNELPPAMSIQFFVSRSESF